MLTNAIQTVSHYVAAWFERAEQGFPHGKSAMTLICAGQQGLAWRSVLWTADTEGTLWYSYRDVTQRRVLPAAGSWSAWQQATGAPRTPTQLSSCVIDNRDGGLRLQFALANGVVYSTAPAVHERRLGSLEQPAQRAEDLAAVRLSIHDERGAEAGDGRIGLGRRLRRRDIH